jgi:hypothetical protein
MHASLKMTNFLFIRITTTSNKFDVLGLINKNSFIPPTNSDCALCCIDLMTFDVLGLIDKISILKLFRDYFIYLSVCKESTVL